MMVGCGQSWVDSSLQRRVQGDFDMVYELCGVTVLVT